MIAISLTLGVGFMALGVVLWFRNEAVYQYRTDLTTAVSRVADSDIRRGQPWQWRYEAMEAVTYDAMFLRPWRSLDSFYPDKSFLDTEASECT